MKIKLPQQHDQDVENRPDRTGQQLADAQADAGAIEARPRAAQQRDST